MLLGKAFLGLDACKRSLKGLVDRSGPLRSLMGLTEVDKGLFQVKRVEGGELYQSFLIQQEAVSFEWELMNVYELLMRIERWISLVNLEIRCQMPCFLFCCGGNFNIVSRMCEKIKWNY